MQSIELRRPPATVVARTASVPEPYDAGSIAPARGILFAVGVGALSWGGILALAEFVRSLVTP